MVYLPHRGRTQESFAEDTIEELRTLLKTVPKRDCVIVVCGEGKDDERVRLRG